MRKFYYTHVHMKLWKIGVFLYPYYAPLNAGLDIDVFNLPRAPSFYVWPIRWIRSLRIVYMRWRLTRERL